MNKTVLLIFMIATSLLAGCATQTNDPFKAVGIKSEQKFIAQYEDDPEKQFVCTRTKKLGSHLIKKHCIPKELAERQKRETDKAVERRQRGVRGTFPTEIGPCTPNPRGTGCGR